MAADGDGRLPLHLAGSEAAAQLLLATAPATAMVRDALGRLTILVMLWMGMTQAARTVLPATETHAALVALTAA